MKSPLVSVIIPCYNQANFLAETLTSVLQQTYPYWECIIVNDGSTDNTADVIAHFVAYDKRFQTISQSNQGVAVARNNAIKQAKGTYILPLDGDDLIDTTYLHKAVTVFETQPATKLVYCKADMFGTIRQQWNLAEYNYDDLLWENMIFVTAMYRKDDFNISSGYNTNLIYGYEDWDFWLSFLDRNDKVYQINEVLFHYRIHDVSRNQQGDVHFHEVCMQIYRNHPQLYTSYMEELVYFKSLANYGRKKEMELEHVLQSYAYRLGKSLLRPIACMRHVFLPTILRICKFFKHGSNKDK